MSRYARVASQLKKEISNILHDELKDPRIGFITVTRIELSLDLKLARIYYSVFGSSQERIDTAEGLKHASGFIRRLIAQRLNLKFTPQILFKEDTTIEASFDLDSHIKKIKGIKDDRDSNPEDKTE